MNQLQLNLILPPSNVGNESLPTETGYQPDWELEQEAFFEGNRVLWKGQGATVNKVWIHIQKARICVDKTFKIYTVPFEELEPIAETVEVSSANREQATDNSVGNENCLPTQKCPSEGHFPTEFKQSLEGMETDTLYRLKDLIEGEIEKRSKNLCRETGESDRRLPTQNYVGRKNDNEFLPTTINDWPHPYIEFKKLPYSTKTKGVRYRKAYYLRDHHNKGKSKYLCSKRENIPEHLRELTIYGEDEIPF